MANAKVPGRWRHDCRTATNRACNSSSTKVRGTGSRSGIRWPPVSSALLLRRWPGSSMTPDSRKRASTRSGWHVRASGTLGQTAHCQIAVSLHRTDARGSSPLGFCLYLPQEWTEDRERCRAAGVPEEIGFQTNWQLAVALIDQALDWGLTKPPVVLADAAYGEVTAFREELTRRGLAYAVGISKALAVWPEPPDGVVLNGTGRGRPVKCMRFGGKKPISVKEAALAHPQRFRTVTWREGSQGPLTSRFWAKRVHPAHGWNHGQAPGKEVWLLVEWPTEESEPAKYYLCDLPKSTSLRQLVAAARGRWRVEQDYQQMKEEVGR